MKDVFHNLTFIQVEALKESLDLLQNGYVDSTSSFSEDLWLLYFKKLTDSTRIKVRVRRFSYVIERDGNVVKSVEGLPDLRRYDVEFDSDVVIKAKRIDLYSGSKLVPGSVLTNHDGR
jgi:hypothetical protein